MEPDEVEANSKSGTSIRSDKNAAIDYDEDRVRLELIVPEELRVVIRVIIVAIKYWKQ